MKLKVDIAMAQANCKEFYERFATDSIPIESHLNSKLAEFVNAEIVLNTICDGDLSVKQWFQTTFCYARMLHQMPSNQTADARVKDYCQQTIQQLQTANLVECKSDARLAPLPLGTVMAKYFFSIKTMIAFRGCSGTESIAEILDKMVHCVEFAEFYLRRTEKSALNDINGGRTGKFIPYPLPCKVATREHKVKCLLQAVLSGVQIESVSLQMDGQKMVEIAERMACGLIDYFQAIQFERKCFSAILAATNLRKSLKLRAWSDSQFSQALKLPDADVNKLIQSGIRSVDSLLQRHPREIEDILKKDIPFGSELISEVAKNVPCYQIRVDVMAEHTISIRVTQTNVLFEYTRKHDDALHLLVGDSGNRLILYEDILNAMNENEIYEKLILFDPSDHGSGFAHLIHSNIVGADRSIQFKSKSTATVDASEVSLPTASSPPKVNPPKSMPKTTSKSKSVRSVSSTNTRGSIETYFKKVSKLNPIPKNPSIKSTFAVQQSKKPNQNVIRSLVSFATPTPPAPNPSALYDFSYMPCNSETISSSEADNEENNRPDKISQELQQTQIQNKIQNLIRTSNTENGFVRAKSIFENAINKQHEADDVSNNNISKSKFKPISMGDVVSECELDDVFVDMLYDELNDHTKNGLPDCPIQSAAKFKQFILSPLHLNCDKKDLITKDFDEVSCSTENSTVNQSMPQKRLENQKAFFSNHSEVSLSQSRSKTPTIPLSNSIASEVVRTAPTPSMARVLTTSQPNRLNRNTPKSNAIVSSQASARSNMATCGSAKRKQPSSSAVNNSQRAIRPSISQFSYTPPHAIGTPISASQVPFSQRAGNFRWSDTPASKRQKLSIDELVANDEKKRNDLNKKQKRSTFFGGGRLCQKDPVSKLVSRNVFAKIDRPPVKSTFNTDDLIKRCEERLKTDPNYKSTDFRQDVMRIKILKMEPEITVKEVQVNDENCYELSSDGGEGISISPENFDEFYDDDFPMMNLATPESYTPFFENNHFNRS